MTAQVLEKILLIADWWYREQVCKEHKKNHGNTCSGCPYNADKYICDSISTVYALESAGKVFYEEYVVKAGHMVD